MYMTAGAGLPGFGMLTGNPLADSQYMYMMSVSALGMAQQTGNPYYLDMASSFLNSAIEMYNGFYRGLSGGSSVPLPGYQPSTSGVPPVLMGFTTLDKFREYLAEHGQSSQPEYLTSSPAEESGEASAPEETSGTSAQTSSQPETPDEPEEPTSETSESPDDSEN